MFLMRQMISGAVFCSLRIDPSLSRKMSPRARIYALYGRSVRARGRAFSMPFCLDQKILAPDIFCCVDVGYECGE